MTTTVPTTLVTLQMVRAEIEMREFQRWMGTRGLQDPDHAMHCLLKECFGDLAPKPFRLITPRGCSIGTFYGYGQANAASLREASSMYAEPLQSRIIPGARLDSKPMPAQWRAGLQLGFETRIRPIVRLLQDTSRAPSQVTPKFADGSVRAGKECDAFLWQAIQHPDRHGMQRSREEVYREWLADQLTRRGGATLELERTKLVSFQRTQTVRKLRARPSEGPDAVMRGVLTVTDSHAFNALLAQGIGRHRAYGYGMLLLRPASG